VLNSQGNAVAGLTVPYVKRIEDTVSIPHVIKALRRASRQISEAMGALAVTEDPMGIRNTTKPSVVKTKK
jgi:hypothetical protein